MSREALKAARITKVATDGNREFISLLACINADGTALPPALIYQGKSNDLQSSWLDEIGNDLVYFAASENGWSYNSLGSNWLEKVFDPATKAKAGRSRRLLIVDGHSSHVNMAFLKLADRMRIIIGIMPPHSTHRIQPLDIGMFGPLSIAYTNQLNQLQHSSLGLVSMTKRLFYPLFRDSWKEAFTTDRIQHAFEKAGIWPLDSERTIGPLRRPVLELASPKPILARTPLTSRTTRRVHKEYKRALTQKGLALIFRGHEELAAKDSINQHIIKGLQQSLKLEKKEAKARKETEPNWRRRL